MKRLMVLFVLVFSLAGCAYDVATGKYRFAPDRAAQVVKDVSAGLPLPWNEIGLSIGSALAGGLAGKAQERRSNRRRESNKPKP